MQSGNDYVASFDSHTCSATDRKAMSAPFERVPNGGFITTVSIIFPTQLTLFFVVVVGIQHNYVIKKYITTIT